MKEIISIGNQGMELVETNYFETDNAKKGLFYLSFNAGACRLLIPKALASKKTLKEMKTGKTIEVALELISGQEGYTVVFDDGTQQPYLIQTSIGSSDRKLIEEDHKQSLTVIVYFEKKGEPVEVLRKRGWFNYNL